MSEPEWYVQAMELERQDRLAEAEQVMAGIVLVQLAVGIAGILLAVTGRPWLAAAVAALPSLVLLAGFIYVGPA